MAITREEAQNLGLVELYDEVKFLETLTEQRKIIEKLQDIGAKLLTEYEVQVGACTIELLLIEAYYNNPSVGFEDFSVHNNPHQQNNFGALYFHSSSNAISRKGGADLCLSLGDYSLSFLLKNTVLNGEFITQSMFHHRSTPFYNSKQTVVLKKRPAPIHEEIIFLPRKFSQAQCSNNLPTAALAILPISALTHYELTLSDGYKKIWSRAIQAICNSKNMKDAKALAKELNHGEDINANDWELAETCWKNRWKQSSSK